MDPGAIFGLAVTAGQIVKYVYDIATELKNAPQHICDLCDELIEIQNVLGRISSTLKFEAGTPLTSSYNDKTFRDTMNTTRGLLEDLLDYLKKAKPGSYKQRLSWLWNKKEIEDIKRKIELNKPGERQRKEALRQWLGGYDSSPIHAKLLTQHEPGTGSWFVTNGKLSEWLQQATNGESHYPTLFWLQGISGSGKSCLMAYAIEKLLQRWEAFPDRIILYFHCSFQDNSSQSITGLLGSLISQICDADPDLWDTIRKDHKEDPNSEVSSKVASQEILSKLFRRLSKKFKRVLIFLDAPNETPEPGKIIGALLTAAAEQHTAMQICISSTPELEMKSIADKHTFWTVKMDDPGQEKDMSNYAKSRIEKSISLRSLNPQLKNEIVQTLMAKADGSFRYIECHLSALAQKDCVSHIKAALASLPPSLNKHYADVLRGMPTDSVSQARIRRLLRLITVQTRHLTIKELEEAIVVDWSQGLSLLEDDRILPGKMNEYLRLCGSLVQYDSETQTATLAHSSVKEFLQSNEIAADQSLQNIIPGPISFMMQHLLRVCLGYLLLPAFSTGYQLDVSARAERHTKWPLLKYCAESLEFYWQESWKLGPLPDDVVGMLKTLCGSNYMTNGGYWGTYLEQTCPQYIPHPGASHRLLTPLGYAAGRGWNFMVMFMIEHGMTQDLDTPSSFSALPPLLRATCYRQEDTAAILLNAGALVVDCINGTSPGVWWGHCSPNLKSIISQFQTQQMLTQIDPIQAQNMYQPYFYHSGLVGTHPTGA
ncbi:hypothetical protein Hte_007042 [Hypoxylon texense]